MRHAFKWTTRLLLTFSMLLCICMAALWIRTVAHTDCLGWASTNSYGELFSESGGLIVTGIRFPAIETGWTYTHYGPRAHLAYSRPEAWDESWSLAGFAKGTSAARRQWFIVVPYWFLMLITLAGPALWSIRRSRRNARFIAGHCATCGYDLRASGGRCPECGSSILGGATKFTSGAAEAEC